MMARPWAQRNWLILFSHNIACPETTPPPYIVLVFKKVKRRLHHEPDEDLASQHFSEVKFTCEMVAVVAGQTHGALASDLALTP